jgi:hypothetical protein
MFGWCRRKDKKQSADRPAANPAVASVVGGDPGAVPDNLPDLTNAGGADHQGHAPSPPPVDTAPGGYDPGGFASYYDTGGMCGYGDF